MTNAHDSKIKTIEKTPYQTSSEVIFESTFFSFTGRALVNSANAIATQSLSTSHISNVFLSALRASLASFALCSIAFGIKHFKNDASELAISTQMLISVFAATLATLPNADLHEICLEFVSSGLGLIATLLLISICDDENNDEKSTLKTK